MSITLTQHEQSAERLVEELPTRWPSRSSRSSRPGRRSLRPPGRRRDVRRSGHGGPRADADGPHLPREAAGAGSQLGHVSVTDVLRPAMESASSVFGAGVLSDLREADASGLLSDPDTAVFELSDGVNPAAWFAVRLREHGGGRGPRGTLQPATTPSPAGWAGSTTSRWP